MKARIIALLGNGVSNAIAASAVGCTESYISQLASDPEIADEIATLRFNNLQAASLRDKEVDTLEDSLLVKLKEVLPLMMRPGEILKAFAVVNAAKRRGASAPEQTHIANQVIHLMLPKHTTVSFQLSAVKEIIEVEGRALVTMPSSQLLMEAAAARKEDEDARTLYNLPREANSTATTAPA